MKHRGEIVKKAIDSTSVKKQAIASALNVSLSTLYRLFEDPFVTFDDIITIGKTIKHDFSKEFPELANPEKLQANEENLDYKLKYFELLEKHLHLLEEQREVYERTKKK